jgi:hypothetical protein
MNDLELQEELRAIVDDAARPVSAAEAMLHAANDKRSQPVRLALVSSRGPSKFALTAAGVVALALAAALVMISVSAHVERGGRSTTSTSSPTTNLKNVLPVALVMCVEHPPVSDGCPVTTAEARQMLGVDVPDPGFIPPGWILGSRTIRGWPAGYFGQAQSESDFNEYWYLPGAGPDSGAPQLIELEVHLPSQGTNSDPGGQSVQLASGAEATGQLQDGSSQLLWLYKGAGLRVTTYGISTEEILQFVNGLQFSSS